MTTVDPPRPSLFRVVCGHSETSPSAPALVTEVDGVCSYRDLAERSRSVAWGLRDRMHLAAGDRVGLWLDNRPEWVEAYLACEGAGLATVGLNPRWTASECAVAAEIADLRTIVCSASELPRAREVADRSARIDRLVVVDLDRAEGRALPYEALARGRGGSAPPSDHEPPAPVGEHIVFTSGTSSRRPKAVRNRRRSAGGVDFRELIGITPADRSFVVTPFFHVNGLGGLTSALAAGASAAFPRRFSASRFWDFLKASEATYLMTLAPLVHLALSPGPGPWEREHALRVAIVPGAGANIGMMEERLGVPVLEWYGMTEATGSGTCTRLGEPSPPGSAGRRIPGSSMTILDEQGSPVAANVIGEVAFERDSIVFVDYLNDAASTAAVLRDGHFHTGDLGYFDDAGYFFYVDRIKDIVRRAGENISSLEVEDAVRGLPGVADVAVVPAPHPLLGEEVAAFVVLDGGDEWDDDAAAMSLRATLARYKVPSRFVIVTELPKTASGKVQKALLRDQLRAPS